MFPSVLVVTAADDRYRRSLTQLLASIERVDPAGEIRVLVADLGLGPTMRARATARFPRIAWADFDLSHVPAFARPRARRVNTNGWKPRVVDEAFARAGRAGVRHVLWLDAASVLTASPAPALRHAEGHGLWIPFGGKGSIGDRTHPTALASPFAPGKVPATALRRRMRASGVMAFDTHSDVARWVCDTWTAGCADPTLLCPPGATLDDHRFDQSVLNLVLECEGPFGRVADRIGTDALDISSAHPVPWLRSRNKVHRSVPDAADPLVRAWFRMRRDVDVTAWRVREALAPRGPETATRDLDGA
ncbi:MAG: hypothetical protein U0169_24810 [Polyangiaceae bacterium]